MDYDMICGRVMVDIIPKHRFFDVQQCKIAEYAGRLCYNSINRITEDSYEQFLAKIQNNKHLSVLEHRTVVIRYSDRTCSAKKYYEDLSNIQTMMGILCPFRVIADSDFCNCYMITNYRYLMYLQSINSIYYSEDNTIDYNNWAMLNSMRKDTFELFEQNKRISVFVIAPISITRELNRHRCLSISEQSTRYCKIGLDLIVADMRSLNETVNKVFESTVRTAENAYNTFIDASMKAQDAREVLPLATMSKAVYTGFVDQWEDVIRQRDTTAAHPKMRELIRSINKYELYYNTLDTIQ